MFGDIHVDSSQCNWDELDRSGCIGESTEGMRGVSLAPLQAELNMWWTFWKAGKSIIHSSDPRLRGQPGCVYPTSR